VKKRTKRVKNTIQISIHDWHSFLLDLSKNNAIYIPVKTYDYIDYKLLTENNINVAYNIPKPVTPLKSFFLPVKENVVIEKSNYNKNIIIGIPACDLKALEILDEIYLDANYIDLKYKENREKSILIGTDCYEICENCHCTSYGIEPYPVTNTDASLVSLNGDIILTVHTTKGEELLNKISVEYPVKEPRKEKMELIETKREKTRELLLNKNRLLPDYERTGQLIKNSEEEIWSEHAKTCVSCGACAISCPTCTCFLLIDRPDFEKVRQVDACQYPGFEKIAAGEDPLRRKFVRFRNRYLCKYIWKPESFSSIACTGCGRCIDSCIGNISKNKIFIEMEETS
jgi:sulfhydrogenase subunit beta (sulfur reductase)